MTNKKQRSVEQLLATAAELPVSERPKFLDSNCGEDPQLRAEIEQLLAVQDQADGFFDGLANDIADAVPLELETTARPAGNLGPYRLDELIGSGGMAVVYRASRVDGQFDQQVALKLLHLDMHTPELRARFLAERQLLAQLQHPNIARLLDGGVTDEGRPYLVMELIDGQPITKFCQEQQLPLAEVLKLFMHVVAAVAYLHRHLIVHRDLKPSNILVSKEGTVKVLDFGIAKQLTSEGGPRTVTGGQLLTPQYAAPEQLTNSPISTATDVYGLGAVLHELLSGVRFEQPTTHDSSASRDPTTTVLHTPSKTLKRTDSDKQFAPSWTWRRLSGDLDNICLKALSAEPHRRYASAEQLGADLERHLRGIPVEARPSTAWYRFIEIHRPTSQGCLGGRNATHLDRSGTNTGTASSFFRRDLTARGRGSV